MYYQDANTNPSTGHPYKDAAHREGMWLRPMQDRYSALMALLQALGPIPSTFSPGAENLAAFTPSSGPGFFNPLLSSGAHSNTNQGGAYQRAHGKMSSSSMPNMG